MNEREQANILPGFFDGEADILDQIEPQEEDTQSKEEGAALKKGIRELLPYFAFLSDSPKRIIIMWLHLLGYTNKEIAHETGDSEANICMIKKDMVSPKYPASYLLNTKFAKPYYLEEKLERKKRTEQHPCLFAPTRIARMAAAAKEAQAS